MGKPNSTGRKVTSRKRLRGNIANLRSFRKAINQPANPMLTENNIRSTSTAHCKPKNNTFLEADKRDCTDTVGFSREKYAELLLEGRRIIDVKYFFEQMQLLNQHCSIFGCTINNVFPYKESFSGLQSTIHFHCKMCNGDFKIFTNCNKSSYMDLTTASVVAGIAIGIGFSNTEELFMTLDIPFMSTKTYLQYAEKVNNAWIATARIKMKEAAEEEANFARDTGKVDENGVPLITVISDGCWSKRSYKSNYNALSGAAAVIGQQHGKVLYLGVKNKYCAVCAKAGTTKPEPKKHTCYKNYQGSSSSMEAAILVEAFKKSEEMYGVKYNKFIADGDSSTYKKILESRPYKNLTVEKIECRNHVLRNYCNKLRALSQDTRFPLRLRRLLSSNIMRLRTAVVSAIQFRKNQIEKHSKQELIQLLKNDIQNSIFHVFGQHKNCDNYFCKKQTETEECLSDIQKCPEFYIRLQEHVKCVWINARSLISDVDSNVVEQFNSIIAKHVGGKRVNFSLKGSYQARCAAAVVRFNTRKPLTELHKSICGTDAPKQLVEFELKRVCKIKNDLERFRKKNPRKHNKGLLKSIRKDSDYGENCQKPDLSEDLYTVEKEKFIKGLLTATRV